MEIKTGKYSSDMVRKNWRDVVDSVMMGQHVIVTRSGKEVAAMIPMEDFRRLSRQLEDMADIRAVERNIAADLAEGDPVARRMQELRAELEAEASERLYRHGSAGDTEAT